MVDLVEIWEEAWTSTLNDDLTSAAYPVEQWRSGGRKTKDKPNGYDLDHWYIAGIEHLVDYVEWLDSSGLKIATIGGQPGIELALEAEFGGVKILGFADCVYEDNDGLLLVDYKTGAEEPTSFLQICLYAQMIERMYGVIVPNGSFYMTRSKKLTEPEPLDRYSSDYFDRLFADLSFARHTGPFLPFVDKHCFTCDVADSCYAVGGKRAKEFDPDHPSFGGIAT